MQILDTLNILEATQTTLGEVIDLVNTINAPVVIEGNGNAVVVITLEEWKAIEETLYLNSQPGFLERFQQAVESEELYDAADLGLI